MSDAQQQKKLPTIEAIAALRISCTELASATTEGEPLRLAAAWESVARAIELAVAAYKKEAPHA